MSENESQGTEYQVEDPTKGPHAHIKVLENENEALRNRVLRDEIRGIGLDPEVQLGKAIAESYKGTYEVGDVVKFAEEHYGYTPPETVDVAVQEMALTEQKIEQLNAGSEPVTPEVQIPPLQAADQIFADPEASQADIVAGLGLVIQEVQKQF